MRNIAIAAAACGLLVLGGCGIKGPLYIPQPPKPAAKPAPKGQRATMLKVMAAATFSLFEVIDLHPVAGLRLRDLSDDQEVWLMDMGMELSAPKGIMLATRVIKPADFAMTTGVSVNMTDAVWKAAEKAIGGTRTDIVRHGDRDQFAEAVYRAGVKAKMVL